MSAVEIPASLAPQVVSFRLPRFSFTLHNARSRPLERMTMENLVTIPAVDKIGPRSDTDADGDPIPGTYVVEDQFRMHPDGSDELLFSAVKSVQIMLGIKPGSDGQLAVATSSAAVGGLSLLPRHSTKAQWKAAAADGEKRAFLVDVKNAQANVESIQVRNSKMRASNMDVAPLGPREFEKYQRDVALLNEYNKLMSKSAEEVLAPHREEAMSAELELDAHVRAVAMELADKASVGRSIDKMKLFEELLNDPKVRMQAQKTYKIQKRGHKPVAPQELKDAADAGLGVIEAGLEDLSARELRDMDQGDE